MESHVACLRGRQADTLLFFLLFKDRPQQHGCRLPHPASSSLRSSSTSFWGRGTGGTCARWPVQGVQRQHRWGLEGFLEEKQDNKLQGWQKKRFFPRALKEALLILLQPRRAWEVIELRTRMKERDWPGKAMQTRERLVLFLLWITHQRWEVVLFCFSLFSEVPLC